MNVLSLCSGAGGLELGVRLAVPDAAAVAHVERDCAAIEILAARMEDGSLAPAPIWFDLTTFDGRPLAGSVDLVTAGFPCQPHSLAGSRRGVEDDRWLWDHVWRVVREVRSRLLFVENVPGLLSSGGLDRVLADLAAGGWDAEWDCVPAVAVGAPHIRDRFFLLAADADHGTRGGVHEREPDAARGAPADTERADLRFESGGQPGESDRSGTRSPRSLDAATSSDSDRRRSPAKRIGRLLDGERTTQRDHAHRRAHPIGGGGIFRRRLRGTGRLAGIGGGG